jgi:hypothetical protein
MKRSLRFCEVGAGAGAAAAAADLDEDSSALSEDLAEDFSEDLAEDAAACLPACLAGPLAEPLAAGDGFALALLVCFVLTALPVRAPAGASAKLVSRTASASFVFIIVICLPD